MNKSHFSFPAHFTLVSPIMSQESEHGKWTVSSSEESEGEQADCEKPSSSLLQRDKPSEPRYPCSEARKAAHKRKYSPLEFHDGNSPSGAPPAPKRVSQEGLGWCLSSSDEEDDCEGGVKRGDAAAPSVKQEEDYAPKEVANDKLSLNQKSAGLSGKVQDTWDLLDGGNPFRFFLTKVKGIKSKYNSGALHIKGKHEATAAPACVMYSVVVASVL